MGRRSLHTADELRELIIGASTELIQEHGLAGLSAREIARRIDYSPGTLYNSFENLDDLVFTIEGRVLDRLLEELDGVPETAEPADRVLALAERYLSVAAGQPKLWNLLFEHHISSEIAVPEWYRRKLDTLTTVVETALAPLAQGLSAGERRRAARVLWASIHGLAALTAAEKLTPVSKADASEQMRDLVRTYLAGLAQRQA